MKSEEEYGCTNARRANTSSGQKGEVSDEELWTMYMDGKHTIEELACATGIIRSTMKRRFKRIEKDSGQPSLSGGGRPYRRHLLEHNWGIILAIDDATSTVLYLSFLWYETVEDYFTAIVSIEERGYVIRGIVFDEMQNLFKEFSRYNL
ncbi:MAG: hypothetical protein IKH33_03460 [Bacteroidales bacterium]|nr:hypothetical protein [Bacteroidales bacterium]